jgi:formate dehydrogenase major subunit/formate dehydrogenase alpha subunit
VIVKERLQNAEFIEECTSNFEDWKKSIEPYTPEHVEAITGVSKDEILHAARLYGSSRKAGIFYTMGITQHVHGTENVRAVANLALVTGNIGREFTGVNPLRGQNNVQGACDFGALPNVYPGYQKVDAPGMREKFEKGWGVQNLSDKPGLASTEMLGNSSIKALYIMGENPASTDPSQAHTKKALKSLDFLLVQDIFMTETAELADVVLPGASFAEKEGTFTNTERKVQLLRRAVDPPGQARPDSEIIVELSRRMGYPMEYKTAEDIFKEAAVLWPAIAGIDYRRLERGGLQWPCPDKDHPGTRYLYKDQKFPTVKPAFSALDWTPPAEGPDREFPFILTTGRNLFQYHSGTMTRRVAQIEKHAGRAYAEINPRDAKALGINDGDHVKISSRRGSILIGASVTKRVRAGTVFIPMHYREAAANVLTTGALDPIAKIPELKACAVRVEKKIS